MPKTSVTDEPDKLFHLFSTEICKALEKHNHTDNLIEIVFDLGRKPIARFTDHETELSPKEVTSQDLKQIVSRIGNFDSDHRAGIEKTLHRVSGMYNRKREVVGLTCRYGRAVYGMAKIVEDILSEGKSILFLGRPGVGKTTLLRESSRVLSENHRVIVVDTSNEIGGDGDIPHPAIGKARRMQVLDPSRQHETMIEAVENHNPQCIVIDEIGRRDEAFAARTIAERGVQLIATAHGHNLENLVVNPTLSDLVGGVDTVCLSDDEARRRGTTKTVRERKNPPTFDVLVEIVDYNTVKVHRDIADSVDRLLANESNEIELREINAATDEIKISYLTENYGEESSPERVSEKKGENGKIKVVAKGRKKNEEKIFAHLQRDYLKIYSYGVSRKVLQNCIGQEFEGRFLLVKEIDEADVLLITKGAANDENNRIVLDAEKLELPVKIVNRNSASDLRNNLLDLLNQCSH